MLESAATGLEALPWGVIAGCLAGLMLLNGFASTPPSELTLASAGILVSRGVISLEAAVVACILGNVAGAWLLFIAARRFGRRPVTRLLDQLPFTSAALLDKVETAFEKRGPAIVLVARCIPNVRSVVSVPAGLSSMSSSKFLWFTSCGVSVWAALWVFLGMTLGTTLSELTTSLKYVGLILAVAVTAFVSMWIHRLPPADKKATRERTDGNNQ